MQIHMEFLLKGMNIKQFKFVDITFQHDRTFQKRKMAKTWTVLFTEAWLSKFWSLSASKENSLFLHWNLGNLVIYWEALMQLISQCSGQLASEANYLPCFDELWIKLNTRCKCQMLCTKIVNMSLWNHVSHCQNGTWLR